MQEPSLPLHLQSVWNFNSDKVGLAYLAAVLPALICKSRSLTVHNLVLTTVAASPLAGYYVDQVGSDYITCICLLLALPWWIVMTLRQSLPLFIFSLAAQSMVVPWLHV